MKKNNRRGFTLVELLAVIVILAILMVSAGAGVMATMNNSKINTFKNEVLQVANAASNAYSDISMNSDTAVSNNMLVTSDDGAYQGMCITLSGLVNNGFLEKDLTAYGGVVLVEVPYNGGKTVYNIWMHNNQYGVDGLEKDIVNKMKFDNNMNATSTIFGTTLYTYAGASKSTSATGGKGNGKGIVTTLQGIRNIVKKTNGAETGLQSTDKTGVTIHSVTSDRGGQGTGRSYTLTCINKRVS